MRISIIPTTTLSPTISLRRMGHRSMTTSLSFGRARTRAGTLKTGQSGQRHCLYQKSLPGSNRLCGGFPEVLKLATSKTRLEKRRGTQPPTARDRAFNPAIPMSASAPQR